MRNKITSFLDICSKRASIFIALGAMTGVIMIPIKWDQSPQLKRIDNFNYYNKMYSDWVDKMANKIRKNKDPVEIAYQELTLEEKMWIRRYFNLYSQEYYFYQENLIPSEMWEKLVHGINSCSGEGMVNLKTYPVLVEGYLDWKSKGAFQFPSDFQFMLESKMRECEIIE